jgi:ATP-dependent helicase/nuclease subunit B
VLDGALPGVGVKPDKLTLPLTTIYLPTRRAARGLRDAFLSASGGEALLLPRIRTLGDPEEDEALIFASELAGDRIDADVGAPTIGTLERRLVLMRLILPGRAGAKSHRGCGRISIGHPDCCDRGASFRLPPSSRD